MCMCVEWLHVQTYGEIQMTQHEEILQKVLAKLDTMSEQDLKDWVKKWEEQNPDGGVFTQMTEGMEGFFDYLNMKEGSNE